MKYLISGGCSFAYGQGLEDRNDRYAAQVAKVLSANLVDVSAAGASNDMIALQTIAGINKTLKRGVRPEDVLVVVGWTQTTRMMYWHKQQNCIVSYHFGSKSWDRYINSFVDQHMWNPGFGFMQLMQSFNYVELFCNSMKIPIKHVKNIDPVEAYLPPSLHKFNTITAKDCVDYMLTKEISKKFDVYMQSESLYRICREKELIDSGAHPTKEGHTLWATKLVEQIETLQ